MANDELETATTSRLLMSSYKVSTNIEDKGYNSFDQLNGRLSPIAKRNDESATLTVIDSMTANYRENLASFAQADKPQTVAPLTDLLATLPIIRFNRANFIANCLGLSLFNVAYCWTMTAVELLSKTIAATLSRPFGYFREQQGRASGYKPVMLAGLILTLIPWAIGQVFYWVGNLVAYNNIVVDNLMQLSVALSVKLFKLKGYPHARLSVMVKNIFRYSMLMLPTVALVAAVLLPGAPSFLMMLNLLSSVTIIGASVVIAAGINQLFIALMNRKKRLASLSEVETEQYKTGNGNAVRVCAIPLPTLRQLSLDSPSLLPTPGLSRQSSISQGASLPSASFDSSLFASRRTSFGDASDNCKPLPEERFSQKTVGLLPRLIKFITSIFIAPNSKASLPIESNNRSIKLFSNNILLQPMPSKAYGEEACCEMSCDLDALKKVDAQGEGWIGRIFNNVEPSVRILLEAERVVTICQFDKVGGRLRKVHDNAVAWSEILLDPENEPFFDNKGVFSESLKSQLGSENYPSVQLFYEMIDQAVNELTVEKDQIRPWLQNAIGGAEVFEGWVKKIGAKDKVITQLKAAVRNVLCESIIKITNKDGEEEMSDAHFFYTVSSIVLEKRKINFSFTAVLQQTQQSKLSLFSSLGWFFKPAINYSLIVNNAGLASAAIKCKI